MLTDVRRGILYKKYHIEFRIMQIFAMNLLEGDSNGENYTCKKKGISC